MLVTSLVLSGCFTFGGPDTTPSGEPRHILPLTFSEAAETSASLSMRYEAELHSLQRNPQVYDYAIIVSALAAAAFTALDANNDAILAAGLTGGGFYAAREYRQYAQRAEQARNAATAALCISRTAAQIVGADSERDEYRVLIPQLHTLDELTADDRISLRSAAAGMQSGPAQIGAAMEAVRIQKAIDMPIRETPRASATPGAGDGTLNSVLAALSASPEASTDAKNLQRLETFVEQRLRAQAPTTERARALLNSPYREPLSNLKTTLDRCLAPAPAG